MLQESHEERSPTRQYQTRRMGRGDVRRSLLFSFRFWVVARTPSLFTLLAPTTLVCQSDFPDHSNSVVITGGLNAVERPS